MNKLKGFSLVEIVIVIGIFFVFCLLVLPVAIKEISTGKADTVVKEVRSAINLLGQNSFSRKNNKSYGIALFSDRYVTFVGTNLAQAESSEIFNLSREINISEINLTGAATEIVFAAGSFRPNVNGSFRVGDAVTKYQLNISAQGLITITKL